LDTRQISLQHLARHCNSVISVTTVTKLQKDKHSSIPGIEKRFLRTLRQPFNFLSRGEKESFTTG